LEPEQALRLLGLAGLPSPDPHVLAGFALPMLEQLVSRCHDGQARLPLLALNGPVGAGKSSLGRVLETLAPALGLRLVVASIDDLYLPWPERQRRLAGNPFGVSRVPPGSHDLDLLLDALIRWRQGGELRLPRFDKTLAQGQGDRCGWRQGPCDALVLEGWLMGCQALGAKGLAQALATFDLSRPGPGGAPALEPLELEWLPYWDWQLEAYGPLWQACDGLWLLRPLTWALPRRWRFQAEARQRRRGGGWLPAADLERLVRSSLCSLPPQLYQDPLGVDPDLVMADQSSINGALDGSRVGGLGPLGWAGGSQGHQGQACQGFNLQASAEVLGLERRVKAPAPAGAKGTKAAETVSRDRVSIQQLSTPTASSQPVEGQHMDSRHDAPETMEAGEGKSDLDMPVAAQVAGDQEAAAWFFAPHAWAQTLSEEKMHIKKPLAPKGSALAGPQKNAASVSLKVGDTHDAQDNALVSPEGMESATGPAREVLRQSGSPVARVQGLAVLDGRRRSVAILGRRSLAQDSLSDSSSLIG